MNTGVGYTLPFECLAAPWIDRDALVNAINAENIPGLRARPISYQPRYAAYTGQTVHGAHLMITDQRALGTDHIRLMIARGETAEAVLKTLAPRLEAFTEMRGKYLIYGY